MKVIKPDYYDNFACDAAECVFTCCQDWKITVDEKTKRRWQKLPCPEPMKAGKKRVIDYVTAADGGDEIILKRNGKCPFLDEKQLCNLVKAYGEGCLSHTCHTFPRERHEHEDRIEYALSVGCPKVLHMLWGKPVFSYDETDEITECAKENVPNTPAIYFHIRDWFASFLKDESNTIPEALQTLFYIALDMFEKEEAETLTENSLVDYKNQDLLQEILLTIRGMKIDQVETFLERNELLLDLAENYRKKGIYTKILEPIALQAENNSGLSDYEVSTRLFEFQKVFERYVPYIRTLMEEEIYSSCLLPEGDLYSMVMKLEWLAVEYAVLCQWSYLHWDKTGRLEREDFLKLVAVLFRMTGYSEADIEEYLDNSFEDVIWEWGYFALITGK